MVRGLVALIACVGCLLLGLQAHGDAQTDDPAQEAPSLTLTPSEGPLATEVRADGEGYCELGSVTLSWDDGELLVTGEADEHGEISLTFPVPEAMPGQHTVTSISECGGTSADFTVVQPDDELPTEPPPPPPPPGAPPPGEAPPPGAAPGPQPPPGSTLDVYERLIKRELESGVILYNPPERMRVGDVHRVEARITRELSDELSKGLEGEGTPRVEILLVGTSMRARLEGGAFDITSIGSEVQQLPTTGFREWRWDVTPVTSGNHPLFFTVSVLYEDTLIEEKVLERRIDIAVNPGHSFLNWMSTNWASLIAALVGVVAIIEGSRRWMKRKQEHPKGPISTEPSSTP